jgi:hypothetical protein
MKRVTIFLRSGLLLLVCLGTFTAVGEASSARNRCKDHCQDRYNLRKDACKAIPYKRERHSCEDAAKHDRDRCKRECR